MVRDLPAALGELRLEGFQPFQPYKNLVLIRRFYSFAGTPNRTNSPERLTSEMSRKTKPPRKIRGGFANLKNQILSARHSADEKRQKRTETEHTDGRRFRDYTEAH